MHAWFQKVITEEHDTLFVQLTPFTKGKVAARKDRTNAENNLNSDAHIFMLRIIESGRLRKIVEYVIDPEPETAEPETAEPETAEPKTAEPETTEPETTEPETAEPETAEPDLPHIELQFKTVIVLHTNGYRYKHTYGSQRAAQATYDQLISTIADNNSINSLLVKFDTDGKF